MNLLQICEQRNIEELSQNIVRPSFRPGDTLKVHFEITPGSIQVFEGVCIARKNRGIGSSFTVRKISAGNEGVERIFPFYSPRVKKVELVRTGRVRRAKLYYLRDLQGKAARIRERVSYHKKSTATVKN